MQNRRRFKDGTRITSTVTINPKPNGKPNGNPNIINPIALTHNSNLNHPKWPVD